MKAFILNGEPQKAIELAQAQNPHIDLEYQPDLLEFWSLALFDEQKYDDALQKLEKSIRMSPSLPRYFQRLLFLLEAKMYMKAISKASHLANEFVILEKKLT